MTPVDGEGHFIIDFSLYDAYQAGFRRVAFIIKHEIEKTFRETIGARMEKFFHVAYVYQELDCLAGGAFPFPLDAKSLGHGSMRSLLPRRGRRELCRDQLGRFLRTRRV